jgi:hypothetical protein
MVTRCIGKHGALLLSAALLLLTAAPLFAQTPSLGEIAKKEQERRKGTKAPTKVLTNDDLKGAGISPAPPQADTSHPASEAAKPEGPAAQAENKKSEKQADDTAAPKGEQEWRARITSARDELHRNEVFVEALQSRINALTADFAARDNPIQRAQIADERQKALADLERVKTDVEKSKKQIADIEEEARKAGVPPGWLR